jgi:NAD(P)H-binding
MKESRSHAGFLIRCLAPLHLRTEFAQLEARENIIRQSRLEWTLVRSAVLTNSAHKAYRSGEDISARGLAPPSISRADVADFMLRQLTEHVFFKKAPMIMY